MRCRSYVSEFPIVLNQRASPSLYASYLVFCKHPKFRYYRCALPKILCSVLLEKNLLKLGHFANITKTQERTFLEQGIEVRYFRALLLQNTAIHSLQTRMYVIDTRTMLAVCSLPRCNV